MKTTIVIADVLLIEARRIAAQEGTTLRALTEEGLQRAIAARRQVGEFTLPDMSYGSGGLSPDLEGASWADVRDLSYEGRGA